MTRYWPAEAEQAVLGAILSAASYSADAGHRIYRRAEAVGLDPAHFGAVSHLILYATIGRMVDAGLPVDAVSLAAELDRDHADPHIIGRLRVLAASVPAFNTIDRHARIVVDAATRREIEERAS